MAKRTHIKTDCIRDLDVFSFDGSIDDIIDTLRTVRSTAEADGYRDIRIVVEQGYEHVDIELYGDRDETEKERKQRLAAAKKKREANKKKKDDQEKRELAELARLQAKYGT